MTTSVETVIKLACTNLAGTLFFCIPCLKLLYELQAPIIGGGGVKWNKNKNMNKKIEVVGVQKRCYVPELFD